MRLKALSIALLASAAFISGCGSKEKKDENSAGGSTPPAIETAPMSFDPAGSDSGKIPGLQTIQFDYDSSKLTSDARAKIKGNAEWLKANPSVNIQIEGHCDARGTTEYNLALGERRAKAVKDYIVTLGVATGRVSIISMGEEKPLVAGETEAAYAKNRRGNFVPFPQSK